MKYFAASLVCLIAFSLPARAELLIGMCQYHEVDGKIGVRVSNRGKVARVHPHSPADQAGIKTGDLIVEVDGKKGNVDHIHGRPGTLVGLTVKRADTSFSVDVPRIDYRDIE